MAISPGVIRTRFAEIRHGVARLREAGQLRLQTFEADENLRDATLYRLLTVIEFAQALCTHITAQLPTRAPESAPDCFLCLSEAGLVSEPLARRLLRMARFRNLLVHRYWEIDYARVHQLLSTDLNDLELFLSELAAGLKL